MAINITKCAAGSMIVKPCYQRLIDHSLSKITDDENKGRSAGFRTYGSGGGDGHDGCIIENGKNRDIVESKGTQTDYRESEAQTSPWESPYKLLMRGNDNPEILNLGNLTWGNGLPAGMHEVEIIKRMRMKRAWMEILPPMDTPGNIKTCERIISAIEANEWAFREAEIQFIMDSRMELMERIKEENARIKEEKIGRRIERFTKRLSQQRDKQIHDIRGKFLREVRKLNRKHRGSSATPLKFRRSSIIATYANPCSQLYAPEMRFGVKSEGRHEIMDKKLLAETYVDREIRVDDSTKWLPTDEELQKLRSIPRPEELCARRTRWTDEKLRKLHADLKDIRLNDTKTKKKDKPCLLKRKVKPPDLPVTPLKRRSENDDDLESSSLLIQKITRGRAVQCMMFEGRERCRKLIEELRSTHQDRVSNEDTHRNTEASTFVEPYEQSSEFMQDNRLCEMLDSLEGTTVAGMLDMLSKEETRLREERKAHALFMLAERERNRREAEESGRRQLERNRRRELDEMFRQMVKVNQDSVQVYLEDVIQEGIDWVAGEEARQYVEELADKIDASTLKSNENDSDPTKDQEIIAEMVRKLLLPSVNKEIMRKKMRDEQQAYIREAHRAIYEKMKDSKLVEKKNETSDDSASEDFHESGKSGEEDEEESEIASEDRELYNEIKKLI